MRNLRTLPKSDLWVGYDRVADVLHITVGSCSSYEGEGLPGGIEVDYRLSDGSPCGAKVIGFLHYGWGKRLPDIARELGARLDVSDQQLRRKIEAVIG